MNAVIHIEYRIPFERQKTLTQVQVSGKCLYILHIAMVTDYVDAALLGNPQSE